MTTKNVKRTMKKQVHCMHQMLNTEDTIYILYRSQSSKRMIAIRPSACKCYKASRTTV